MPTIPTKPYDQLLWQAWVRGASFPDGIWPDPDDVGFWEGTETGQLALADFEQWSRGMKRTAVATQQREAAQVQTTASRPPQMKAAAPAVRQRRLCPLDRPYDQHDRRCHPECDYRPATGASR